jgi:hypothetical protein
LITGQVLVAEKWQKAQRARKDDATNRRARLGKASVCAVVEVKEEEVEVEEAAMLVSTLVWIEVWIQPIMLASL